MYRAIIICDNNHDNKIRIMLIIVIRYTYLIEYNHIVNRVKLSNNDLFFFFFTSLSLSLPLSFSLSMYIYIFIYVYIASIYPYIVKLSIFLFFKFFVTLPSTMSYNLLLRNLPIFNYYTLRYVSSCIGVYRCAPTLFSFSFSVSRYFTYL